MEMPINPLQSTRKIQARILIVDDHPGTAETFARALSQLSPELEVISDTSARSALERVKNNAVDMVITDMMMPEMNGLELIDKLRQHPGGRPSYTVLVTAYDVPGLKEMTRRMKVNEMLIKPIRPERIQEVVGKFLDEMQNSLGSIQAYKSNESFKILIVDDKPDNVALLSRYLQDQGYELSGAGDGVEALEKIHAELPDLVLLDINMPKKDGFSVLQEMRADPKIAHIPVIILTANRLDAPDIEAGLNMGADDYVGKPFDRRELIARIRTRLRVKGAEDVVRQLNKQLNLLPEIGNILNDHPNLDEMINNVICLVVETVGAAAGHFIILSSNKVLTTSFHAAGSKVMELPPMNDFLEFIKKTRTGLIIEDTSRDLRWTKLPNTSECSAIIVPLVGRDDLIGAMVLLHHEAGYFNSDHQYLLQSIANQTALAVENVQLYEQVKSLSEQHV